MLPPFISDAKDKTPDIYFSVIRRRMLPPFISDTKDKHPTFILSVIRSRMLPHSFPTLIIAGIYFGILTLPKMIAGFFRYLTFTENFGASGMPL